MLKSLLSSITYNAPKRLPAMLLYCHEKIYKRGLKGLFIMEGAFSLSS